MKFLKAVRLGGPDAALFLPEGMLDEGEWAVSGGFAMCDLAAGDHRRPQCRCDVSFIGLARPKRCTIAEVVEIDETTYRSHVDTLARHLIEEWGAPTEERARRAAEDEVAYTAELCEDFGPEVWITVKRSVEGRGIKEQYSVFRRLLIGDHKL